MKKIYFISFLLMSIFSLAQDLNGSIKDIFGQPIVDVYIHNLTTSQHTHSNEFGNFFLKEVGVNDTLKFTKLGFKSIDLKVTSTNNKIEIILEEDIFRLSEIILSPEDVLIKFYNNQDKIEELDKLNS